MGWLKTRLGTSGSALEWDGLKILGIELYTGRHLKIQISRTNTPRIVLHVTETNRDAYGTNYKSGILGIAQLVIGKQFTDRDRVVEYLEDFVGQLFSPLRPKICLGDLNLRFNISRRDHHVIPASVSGEIQVVDPTQIVLHIMSFVSCDMEHEKDG